MNAATAGLIGAAIGACAGLLGAIGTSYFQLTLEKEKAELSELAAVSGELRREVRSVAQQMLTLQHSMEWVCWSVARDPNSEYDKAASLYQSEAHESIPQLLGAMASVASLDRKTYEALQVVAEDLFVLEGQIAQALATRKLFQPRGFEAFRKSCNEAIDLYRELPERLAVIQAKHVLHKGTE